MKKSFLATLLIFTLGTSAFNVSAAIPARGKTTAEKFCITYSTTYITQTEGGCQVTYRVSTTYLCGIPVCTTKCMVKKVCGCNSTGGSGGGTGDGSGGGSGTGN